MNLAHRRALLTTALAVVLLDTRGQPEPPEQTLMKRWLDNWTGIGLIATGMARQDYDLQLTRYADRGWRATFYVAGMEHSATNATGTAWEPTPWRAAQVAAWEVMGQARLVGST